MASEKKKITPREKHTPKKNQASQKSRPTARRGTHIYYYGEEYIARATPLGQRILRELEAQHRTRSSLRQYLAVNDETLLRMFFNENATIYLGQLFRIATFLAIPVTELFALIYGADREEEARASILLDTFFRMTTSSQDLLFSLLFAVLRQPNALLTEDEQQQLIIQPWRDIRTKYPPLPFNFPFPESATEARQQQPREKEEEE